MGMRDRIKAHYDALQKFTDSVEPVGTFKRYVLQMEWSTGDWIDLLTYDDEAKAQAKMAEIREVYGWNTYRCSVERFTREVLDW